MPRRRMPVERRLDPELDPDRPDGVRVLEGEVVLDQRPGIVEEGRRRPGRSARSSTNSGSSWSAVPGPVQLCRHGRGPVTLAGWFQNRPSSAAWTSVPLTAGVGGSGRRSMAREAKGQGAAGERGHLRGCQGVRGELERHAGQASGRAADQHQAPSRAGGRKRPHGRCPRSPVADLHRSTRWAGLRPGDAVQVEGTRLRAASWEFVAHVTNGETGEAWGRGGGRPRR